MLAGAFNYWSESMIDTKLIKAITACYKDKDKDPMILARLIDSALIYSGGIADVGRAAKVPIGGLSKYHRLLLLPEDVQWLVSQGMLTFRVAREFAGKMLLERKDFDSLLRLFTSKQLQNGDIEKFMMAVRKHPHLSAPDYRDMVLRSKGWDIPEPVAPVKRDIERATPRDIQESALELMARLMIWQPDKTIDTMMAVSSLKKLKPYIDRAAS